MSMELYVAVPAGELPSSADLVARAKGVGFEIALGDGFSLAAASGFQPVLLDGRTTGVEIDLFGLEEMPELDEVLAEKAATLDRIVAFRWGGDFLEGGLAYVLAAALAADDRCVCYDPQEDAVMTPARLAEVAVGMIAYVE